MSTNYEPTNLCVVGGSGYVGFITGLGFAELGNNVINVDIDSDKVEMMNNGESPIYEEGIDLSEVLKRNLDADHIEFTTDLEKGVKQAEVIFIAVGTPEKENGEADLSQVIRVAEDLYDFFHPTRIVIGTHSDRAKQVMRALYQPFIDPEAGNALNAVANSKEANSKLLAANSSLKKDVPLVETDLKSAQMIKYASNSFLASRISFINEIAGLCEKVGADVTEVAKGMGYDNRIGHEYLQAGIGFGGPCLEKDLKALIKISENNNYEPRFLNAILEKNHHQVKHVVNKVKELAGYPLYKKIITIYGLAFKAGTNDVRTSLSLRVIEQLQNLGAEIKAHDPEAISEAKEIKPDIEYYQDPYQAVQHAEALLILTDWPDYKKLDFDKINQKMNSTNLIDGRNILNPQRMKSLGFNYTGMGRS